MTEALQAPERPKECEDEGYAELVIFDVQGLIDKVSADQVQAFRTHEKTCAYCQQTRQRIGGRLGPGDTHPKKID